MYFQQSPITCILPKTYNPFLNFGKGKRVACPSALISTLHRKKGGRDTSFTFKVIRRVGRQCGTCINDYCVYYFFRVTIAFAAERATHFLFSTPNREIDGAKHILGKNDHTCNVIFFLFIYIFIVDVSW